MRRRRQQVLDELLVLRSQAGESAALEALVERWNPRLLRHAGRLTGQSVSAHDVVQEAWLAIVRSLGRLDDPARFPSWAYRIVSRKAVDWVRRQQRRRRLDDRMAADNRSEEVAPQTDRAEEDDVRRLQEALAAMPEDRRVLLSMLYVDGLSVAEIASAMEVPPGTVKSRLFHARNHLRKILED